jgi:hypothetical protein
VDDFRHHFATLEIECELPFGHASFETANIIEVSVGPNTEPRAIFLIRFIVQIEIDSGLALDPIRTAR